MARRTTSRSRGRLPSSVYWRRRLAVLSIGALLVVGLTRLIVGAGGDPVDTASPVSGPGKPAATVTVTPTPSQQAAEVTQPSSAPSTSSAPPAPTGACAASDIQVKPELKSSYAYDDVTIPLVLRTVKSPACLWNVSADALQVRISSKSGDDVWSTVDCPQAVPAKQIVVRRDTTVTLPLTWSSRRVVAGECTPHGPWVRPNKFTVVASSLGGEPASASFGLYEPGQPISTSTASSGAAPSSGATTPSGVHTPSATAPSSGAPTSTASPTSGQRGPGRHHRH